MSNTELFSLLKRALESSGGSNGRYEEAAHAIWWLESRGYKWLDDLAHVWPRLFRATFPTPELLEDHPATSVIDASGASLLHCGPNSIDLAFANAFSESLASVEIRHCRDRIMILPGLAVLARRGASAVARWRTENSLHVATVRAGSMHPTYTEYAVPETERLKHSSLLLVCSLNYDGVNHYLRNMSKLTHTHDILTRRLPEQFKRCASMSLENGIRVSDDSISILKNAGDMILVEDAKQSRMEAG